MATVYPFSGTIQHYSWGGYDYLPSFLHQENPDHEPWAELWMGTHAKGPGQLRNEAGDLAQLIEGKPDEMLGPTVAERFEKRLPFLFKVLDVREMLSIQVHPSKAAAERGFAAEEESGPPRDAPDRNYRDDNHKPELGVALTDFFLLHGFRSRDQIERTLHEVPGWKELLPVLTNEGVKGLYAHVMRADQTVVDRLLRPLRDALSTEKPGKDDTAFWAKRAFEQYTSDGHFDRGVFSIYWFNLVHLKPGEGIFQDAGIPHAYLEGVCLELMANSDNVLRGGLTPKHIDVPELIRNTSFEAVLPDKLRPQTGADGWEHYPTPAPDFNLSFRDLPADATVALTTAGGPCILLLLDGSVKGGNFRLSERERTVFLPQGEEIVLEAEEASRIFRATVGS